MKEFTTEEKGKIREGYLSAEDKKLYVQHLCEKHTASQEEILKILGMTQAEFGTENRKVTIPPPTQRKVHSEETKRKAVQAVASGESARSVAARMGLNQPTVSAWVRAAQPAATLESKSEPQLADTPETDPLEMADALRVMEDMHSVCVAAQEFLPASPEEQRVINYYLAKVEGFIAGMNYARDGTNA